MVRIAIIGVILVAIGAVVFLGVRALRTAGLGAASKHDVPPQLGNLPSDQVNQLVEEQLNSPYAKSVADLLSAVRDRVVLTSRAGRSGYLLHFNDGTWAAIYLADRQLKWRVGSGASPADALALLDSPDAGDGRAPLAVNLPYADEECDIGAEVAKAHGQPVRSVAIGSDSFNLVFPGNRELDAMLVPDKHGVLALRVFWEQW